MKERRKMTLGNKAVYFSEPFVPQHNVLPEFIGREKELRLITAAWMASDRSLPLSPLLVGEPGMGKNRIIYELAQKTGRDLYIFQGHEDVTAEDLACAVRFSDQNNAVMDYILSPLVTAMITGGIIFIDEIGKIRPRALALLVSVLDERRYIDSTLLGERIIAHPAFRFIAATNTAEINLLPEFINSRMRPVITIEFPPRAEIEKIILSQYTGMQKEISKLLDIFWLLWVQYNSSHKLSPRDAIYLFSLAENLSAFENAGGGDALMKTSMDHPFDLKINSISGIKPSHLETAFRQLFSHSNQN